MAQAEEWTETYGDDLNELERSFLQASLDAQRATGEVAQRSRRRVMVGLITTLIVVSLLLILSLVLGSIATRRQREAERQRNLAEARAVAVQALEMLETNPPLAALLALAAQELAETDEATQVIAQVPYRYPPIETTLVGHSDFINSVAFSPDGQQLASSSGDQIINSSPSGFSPNHRRTRRENSSGLMKRSNPSTAAKASRSLAGYRSNNRHSASRPVSAG